MINAHCKSQPIFWSLQTSHCFIFSSFESPLWHLLPIEDCFVYFENLLCSVAPSFGEGNGTPLQYSCLENPMDGGACWVAIYGVAQSWTWLSTFSGIGEGNGNPLQCSCLENPGTGCREPAYCILSAALFRIWNSSTGILSLPVASVRNSAHDKGHEEGGLAYAKARSSLRSLPGNSRAYTPKTRVCLLSALSFHLHLWLYGGLSPTTSLCKKS